MMSSYVEKIICFSIMSLTDTEPLLGNSSSVNNSTYQQNNTLQDLSEPIELTLPKKQPLWEYILIIGTAAFFGWLFITPYCGQLFQCGCSWPHPIGTGLDKCNIHNSHGPYCPWCHDSPILVGIFVTFGIPFVYSITWIFLRWKQVRLWLRPITGFATALLYGFLLALIFAAADHYPHGVGRIFH